MSKDIHIISLSIFLAILFFIFIAGCAYLFTNSIPIKSIKKDYTCVIIDINSIDMYKELATKETK